MIKNIIFDMGNVLLTYDPFVSLNKFCKEEETKKLIYQELFCSEEWVMGDLGLMDREKRFVSVSKRIPEKYHKELYNCTFFWDICMLPVDGAREFLDRVKKKGYRVYILSNAGKDFYTYFPLQYDLDFFDGVVVSSDIGMIKPDEKIYRYLLEKFSLVPEECLFLDDVEVNIRAAQKVGINGIVFHNNYDEVTAFLKNDRC